MKFLSLLLLAQIFIAFEMVPSRAEETRRLQCANQDPSNSKVYRIIQYVGSDQKFGQVGEKKLEKGNMHLAASPTGANFC